MAGPGGEGGAWALALVAGACGCLLAPSLAGVLIAVSLPLCIPLRQVLAWRWQVRARPVLAATLALMSAALAWRLAPAPEPFLALLAAALCILGQTLAERRLRAAHRRPGTSALLGILGAALAAGAIALVGGASWQAGGILAMAIAIQVGLASIAIRARLGRLPRRTALGWHGAGFLGALPLLVQGWPALPLPVLAGIGWLRCAGSGPSGTAARIGMAEAGWTSVLLITSSLVIAWTSHAV